MLRTSFFHPDECQCYNCTAWNPDFNFNSHVLMMAHPPPSNRLVGVELEISGISYYEADQLCALSKRNWRHVEDSSIPLEGRELVSPPFKTEAAFDKAVEILSVAVNNYGGRAIYAGEISEPCDYCAGNCECDYCSGDCECDYCSDNCQCDYCAGCKCKYCAVVERYEEHEDDEKPTLEQLRQFIDRYYYYPNRFQGETVEEALDWLRERCECQTKCEGECNGECCGECECEDCDGSTGFHVHVDARDLTLEQRKAVFVIYCYYWDDICEWHHTSRHDNRSYCRRGTLYLSDKISKVYQLEKYYAVNWYYAFQTHSTIEFRQAFLPANNPIFVKHWAQWCRGLVDLISHQTISPDTTCEQFLNQLKEWNFNLGEPGAELPSIEGGWKPTPLLFSLASFEKEIAQSIDKYNNRQLVQINTSGG